MMTVQQLWTMVHRSQQIGPGPRLGHWMPPIPWVPSSFEGLDTPHFTAANFTAASVLPESWIEWFLRALLGVLAIAIARMYWRRRVGREEQQKEQEATRLADRTRDLALEKQRAEEANQLKAQLLARISQDIRIPMNEVLNTLERALMTSLTTEQQNLLECTKSSARQVLTRLGGVLDISSAEAEKLLVNRVEFSVRDWVRRVIATMVAPARESGVEVQTDIAVDFPDQLIGDPDLLRKVLHTLLKDAIQLASPGKVILVMRLDRRASNENCNRLVPIFFSVERRGANREKALSTDHSANQRDDGAEPVLAVCDRFLGLMGGRIWVYTHQGRSRICCTIRLEARRPTADEASRAPGREPLMAAGLQALLVEGNRVNQLAMLPVLEKQGLHCLIANNGDEAIVLLERFTLDLIFVTVQTSTLEGLEAARLVREREKQTGSHVPILALTEHITRAHRDACLRAGVDACVNKPVQPAQLKEAIETAMLQSKGRSA
jgi:CheY-like chemotaxis protein